MQSSEKLEQQKYDIITHLKAIKILCLPQMKNDVTFLAAALIGKIYKLQCYESDEC